MIDYFDKYIPLACILLRLHAKNIVLSTVLPYQIQISTFFSLFFPIFVSFFLSRSSVLLFCKCRIAFLLMSNIEHYRSCECQNGKKKKEAYVLDEVFYQFLSSSDFAYVLFCLYTKWVKSL